MNTTISDHHLAPLQGHWSSRQIARLLASLGRSVEAILAVVTTIIIFGCVKGVLGALRVVDQLLERIGITAVFDRSSTVAAILGSGVAVLTATLNDGAALVPTVALAGIVAVIARALPRALAAPATLRAIEEFVRTDALCRYLPLHVRQSVDAIWIRSAAVQSLVVLPVAAAAVSPATSNLATVSLYAVVVLLLTAAANAFEHASAHYGLVTRRRVEGTAHRFTRGTMNIWLTYLVPLLHARTPHWYKVQHVVVHHAEDNGIDDTQSTLRYDRASFIDFARCASKFGLSSLVALDVVVYLLRKQRYRALAALLGGMAVFWGVVTLLAFVNWPFALAILVVKYASSLLTALGFFQEHGMVDTNRPQNVYRNSLHYVAAANEHGSLGDDIHIEHHLHPGAHWSGYAAHATQNERLYAAEGSLAFRDGPGCLERYYQLLWCRDFVGLASLFTVFGRPDASIEERADLLRDRTRPLTQSRRAGMLDRLDRTLGRVVGHLVPEL